MNRPERHILIVEDEVKLASLTSDYLQNNGYDTHCIHAGDEVGVWLDEHSTDLVILDIMLPGMDGLTVCRQIRQKSDVPIIMVTARVEEIDRILGLELGADDYICKPFSPREVVARVKAVLRRPRSGSLGNAAANGESKLRIDKSRFSATLNGKKLDLTPVEFRLLQAFASQSGHVFSRSRLLDAAYNDYRVVSDRTIDSHIKNLRRKLTMLEPAADWIESVYGVGYRFNQEELEP